MKKNKIGLILVTVLILCLVGYLYSADRKRELVSTNYRPDDLKKEQINSQNLSYEVVQKGEALGVESYLIFVLATDPAIVNQIALNVKKQECKNPCNVYLFDEKQAIITYLEYDKLMKNIGTTPEQRDAWNKENYIYVADHYVGTMNYSDDSFFTSYPNRDAYYKTLKEHKL